jgi:hypothetical protein
MNSLTQSKNTTMLPVLIALTLGCFWLSPTPRAVDPPPDGGYPNGTTAEGEDALFSLTTGDNNTAVGFHALFSNGGVGAGEGQGGGMHSDNNTAVGWIALQNNTGGRANTAIGANAMPNNTGGDANIAVGVYALRDNSTGTRNTAIGTESLKKNNGFDNIGVGYEAGKDITTGSFNICVGNPGVDSDTNTIRIGTDGVQTATFITGINGVTVPDGVGVIIDNNGKLGTIVSSARYKEGIKPMDKASEAILSLQPVTFRYKKELDPDAIPQFGLVAEDVAKINPNLVARDDEGKPYSVRYEAVNAMLLNEFLKEHKRNEKQEATIAELKSQVQVLTATLKEQAAQIQKVSAQVAATEPAARLVTNQ